MTVANWVGFIGRKFMLLSNLLVIAGSMFAYFAAYLSPQHFWLLGLASWGIPFFLLANLFFALFWLFSRTHKLWSIGSAVTFIIGTPYIIATFNFPHKVNHTKLDKSIDVLSYNVRVFNAYDHLRKSAKSYKESKDMIKWVKNSDADIICLQEFYNDKNSNIYNTIERIRQKGKYKAFFLQTYDNRYGGEFGMIIFSKYPIINKDLIHLDKNSNNQMMYVDLKIRKDTLRVYNIHLQSMAISEKEIDKAGISDDESQSNLLRVMKRLKNGFKNRSIQTDLLKKHIEDCPYPVLVCGDLNDLPYGYCYNSLSDGLSNAFEEKGSGMGVTYRGKIRLLRIDNQFFDPSVLKINSFSTLDTVKYSDHFPILGNYSFTEK